MTHYGIPILYTLFVWWFSTGVILFLDGLPRKTFPYSIAAAAVLYCLALWGIAASSHDMTVFGAYCTFTCGLIVWGFNEITFLMGYVTGPRTTACPPGCKGWRHFVHAVEAILYHEIGIIVSAVLVAAASWGEPNQVGTWTFMILWLMRLSTKLNIFLGVPNLTEEFLPDHLAYMKGYFRKRPMNWLFPFTVTASTVIATVLAVQASQLAATDPHQAAGLTFVVTLMVLAILEHWFLVMPMSVVPLWRWGLKSREWFRRLDPRRNGSRR
ncbi:putative photosynthetic complex assembly protein PuhE, partial [Rhodoplanes sp. TEM]